MKLLKFATFGYHHILKPDFPKAYRFSSGNVARGKDNVCVSLCVSVANLGLIDRAVGLGGG